MSWLPDEALWIYKVHLTGRDELVFMYTILESAILNIHVWMGVGIQWLWYVYNIGTGTFHWRGDGTVE